MVIDKFTIKDNTWYLSNMYPVAINYNGLTYQTAEAAFQAQKFKPEERKLFTNLDVGDDKRQDALGRMAKKMGGKNGIRKLTDEEIDGWNNTRIKVMKEIIRCKFTQNEELKNKLIATGNAELIEGRSFRPDRFWGISLKDGKGENHLGKILMEVRDELKQGA